MTTPDCQTARAIRQRTGAHVGRTGPATAGDPSLRVDVVSAGLTPRTGVHTGTGRVGVGLTGDSAESSIAAGRGIDTASTNAACCTRGFTLAANSDSGPLAARQPPLKSLPTPSCPLR